MTAKKGVKKSANSRREIITDLSVDALNALAQYYGVPAGDYFSLALQLAINYVPGFPRFKLKHGTYGAVVRDKGGRPTEWTPEQLDELITDVDRAKKQHGFATDDEALRHLTQKWARPPRQDDLSKWVKQLKNKLGRARRIRRVVDELQGLAEKIRANPKN